MVARKEPQDWRESLFRSLRKSVKLTGIRYHVKNDLRRLVSLVVTSGSGASSPPDSSPPSAKH
jgi:hypothetical protein